MHSFPAQAHLLIFKGDELVLVRSAEIQDLWDVPMILIETPAPQCEVVERGLKATSFRDITIERIEAVTDDEHVIFACSTVGKTIGLGGLGSTFGVNKRNFASLPQLSDIAHKLLAYQIVQSRLG